MSERLRIPHGSVEFIKVAVESDVTLDGPVQIAVAEDLDTATWRTAQWLGDPDTTRTARVVLDTHPLTPSTRYSVYVRISAGVETPIVDAGDLVLTTR